MSDDTRTTDVDLKSVIARTKVLTQRSWLSVDEIAKRLNAEFHGCFYAWGGELRMTWFEQGRQHGMRLA